MEAHTFLCDIYGCDHRVKEVRQVVEVLQDCLCCELPAMPGGKLCKAHRDMRYVLVNMDRVYGGVAQQMHPGVWETEEGFAEWLIEIRKRMEEAKREQLK